MFSNLSAGSAQHAAWRGKTDVAGYQISNAHWSGVPLSRLIHTVNSACAGGSSSGETLPQGDVRAASFVEFHGEDGYFVSMPIDLVIALEWSNCTIGVRLGFDWGAIGGVSIGFP